MYFSAASFYLILCFYFYILDVHMHAQSFNHVWLFATLGNIAGQAPLSMGFSRQEYYSGLPLASPIFVWKFLYEYVPNFAWNILVLTLNMLFVVCLKFESGHPKTHVATLLPRTSLILPSLDKITVFHWVLLLHVMKPVKFRRWILLFKIGERGISLAFQWLGLSSSTSGSVGLISGQGTKILHATWHGQKINQIN